MQSEDFDKKIRDAAEHHHPTYDEQAWSKMELLLDKHMPVEKERKRRFLLILFFFMLLGGGAFLWFGTGLLTGRNREYTVAPANDPKTEDKGKLQIRSSDKTSPEQNNIPSEKVSAEPDKNIAEREGHEQRPTITPIKDPENAKNSKALVTGGKNALAKKELKTGNRKAGLKVDKGDRSIVKRTKLAPVKRSLKETKDSKLPTIKKEDPIVATVIQPDPLPPATGIPATDKKGNSKENGKDPVAALTHTAFPSIDSVYSAEYEKPVVTRLSRKKGSFFIAASIAPDLSVVGLTETGKVRTAYGFGVGYKRGRVMLRSGLYVARKVYDAYPEDYKAPAAFYTRYPNLQEIKADCMVYEIPLLVSYDLSKSAKGHWFLTTGISSYLMKRETYDYYYKWNASGPVVHRERTITNANKHYFSVASFSAGYKLSVSKNITILAEPYIKLPLTGIGFGKVKLNSAGVLFSVAFRPF